MASQLLKKGFQKEEETFSSERLRKATAAFYRRKIALYVDTKHQGSVGTVLSHIKC